MMDYKLPDGTWVTTPLCIGVGKLTTQCADGCDWKDNGLPGGDGPVKVIPQVCTKCGWVRGKYTGNPRPEADDSGNEAGPPQAGG